ncbi:hypothetical protein XocBAI15_01460 [Xanthomonas oryzae pv. oryzicola]|nr:hypothetical protein XocBAI15_01460 [Xanthomonas oryzae pv. oryzicola]
MSSPLAGPWAAWMRPSSPIGWVHGMSRERRGQRGLDQPGFQPAASTLIRNTNGCEVVQAT